MKIPQNNQEKFPAYEEYPDSELQGVQRIYTFENGYKASVVKHKYSYGGDKGLWELAVLFNDALVYDTPVTDDVLGYLDDAARDAALEQVANLPRRR